MKIGGIILFLLMNILCWAQESSGNSSDQALKEYSYDHPIPFEPESYLSYFTNNQIIIDGRITEEEWGHNEWTNLFVDIEGQNKPLPFLDCRAKIAWNDTHLFIAARMDEPHIWATLTERDAIMFHDDDFEVFIDPDGDGHNYFELEMNAFNSIWDLYMLYPYYMDDRRNYIMNWDIKGLQSAVHLEGSINEPSDQDQYWSIELAIPWETFKDFKKGDGRPGIGDQWRFNFSRVDWPMKREDGKYVKEKDSDGKLLRERNWVWSPTGYINMHKPETWGYVQFEKDRNVKFENKKEEDTKWALWQLYYQVKDCWKNNKKDCALDQMAIDKKAFSNYAIDLSISDIDFLITIIAEEKQNYSINHLGRLEQFD